MRPMTLGAETFDQNGYLVCMGWVAQATRERAIRSMLLTLRGHGVTAQQIGWDWAHSTWFPHLRWTPEILDLLPRDVTTMFDHGHPLDPLTDAQVQRTEWWGDPQIVVRLPDRDEDVRKGVGEPHIDELPHWADQNMVYSVVFGVAVTETVVRIWRGSHLDPSGSTVSDVHLSAGDVLVMNPKLRHASVPNPSHLPRCSVYFRPVVSRG